MYEQLVKRLRCQRFGNCPNCPMWYTEEVEPNLWRERCAAIDAADAIEQSSKPRWIPVTERLPDFEGAVLCMRKSNVYSVRPYQEILYVDEFGFKNFDDIYLADGVVTHWMPLPQPPEEE